MQLRDQVTFTKMHALGNDFMVIDGVNQSIKLSSDILQAWSNRHRGIGFDQCLLIEPSSLPEVDFAYRIFNADGSEVGQCGNGARCAARFIHENKLSLKRNLTLSTLTTLLNIEIHDEYYQKITVTLGIPHFEERHHDFHFVDLGNPHAVFLVEQVDEVSIQTRGESLNADHRLFPEGVNVGFMEIQQPESLRLRVFERGVGETEACGSGACAAMVCAKKFHNAASEMAVHLPGGTLQISWAGDGSPVLMTGNAIRVFDGVVSSILLKK